MTKAATTRIRLPNSMLLREVIIDILYLGYILIIKSYNIIALLWWQQARKDNILIGSSQRELLIYDIMRSNIHTLWVKMDGLLYNQYP